MSTKTVTICDNCGMEKKETNHWWRMAVSGFTLRVQPQSCNDSSLHVVEENAEACGSKCAAELFERFLAKGSLRR